MGLFVGSYGEGDDGALIITTNYESNTVTILKLIDTTTVESKYVLPTGRGPIAVTMDPYGAIYTANFIDNTVTQYFWNEDLEEYESRTVQTGEGPNAISVRELDEGAAMIVTSNYGDNTLSTFIAVDEVFEPFGDIQTDNKPIAINILSAGDWHRFYWANYESNTVQSSNDIGGEMDHIDLVDNLPWCDVRDGELMDDDDCEQFVVPINLVGLFVDPIFGQEAIVIFEENSPGETSKQHLWNITVDGFPSPPLYLGEFIAPSTSDFTNQRIAVNNSEIYLLSSDGVDDQIIKYVDGTRTEIWTDSDFAAITINMGNLYAAKSSNNTVYKFNTDDELIGSYSMAPTPSIAAPSLLLSSNAETVTAGTPILGYTIDSSAGGAIDSFLISPAVSNGLSFDTSTGLISGTPISATPTISYQILATNPTSDAFAVFSLTVTAAPIIQAPIAPIPPAPTPVPYLRTLTTPKLNLKDGKLICTPGTYNAGYTLDGVVQGSGTTLFTPSTFTYDLLINGIAQTSLAVTNAVSTASWNLLTAPSGAMISCSVTVSANGVTNTDMSTDNTSAVSSALSAQALAIAKADTDYSMSQSANSKAYQKALVDNRAKWRSGVEKIRTDYYAERDRIKSLPATRATRALASAALKAYIFAQRKSATDYRASKPAALAARDAANNSALDAKGAVIAKANAAYGTFIESIGYGVLIS
jgi:Skp family chaperone for outer membrane proteins